MISLSEFCLDIRSKKYYVLNSILCRCINAVFRKQSKFFRSETIPELMVKENMAKNPAIVDIDTEYTNENGEDSKANRRNKCKKSLEVKITQVVKACQNHHQKTHHQVQVRMIRLLMIQRIK